MPAAPPRHLWPNEAFHVERAVDIAQIVPIPDACTNARCMAPSHDAHQVVPAFVAMGPVPFLGQGHILCMRVDRARATWVRSWGGHDREPLELGRGGGRRIRLPIQSFFDYHCGSSSIE